MYTANSDHKRNTTPIKCIVTVLSIWFLSTASTAASSETISLLQTWLKKKFSERSSLSSESFATDRLSKNEADSVVQLIFTDYIKRIESDLSAGWENKEFTYESYRMKFDYRTFGEKPESGRNLFISMHGGGNTSTETNDQQWENQIVLYQPSEGIYLAPRAPTDTWNMWFQSHIDPLFKQIVRAAVLLADVNPNRVYLMGYSAGGDGAYQMGPRMADYWAAAAAMAGHPNESSPVNLRNIGFTIHVGENDDAYDRNKVALEWKQKLDDLQANDPDAYEHLVEVHSGRGHWMELEDSVAIPWMMQFTRNPTPDRIAWRQSDVPCTTFYWLRIPASQARKNNEIVVQRNGQEITIESFSGITDVTLYFNDAMVDLDNEVSVKIKEKVVYTGIPRRTIGSIYETINQRGDGEMIFSAQLQVDCADEKVAVTLKQPLSDGYSQPQISLRDNFLIISHLPNIQPSEITLFSPAGRRLFTKKITCAHNRYRIPIYHHGCLLLHLRQGQFVETVKIMVPNNH